MSDRSVYEFGGYRVEPFNDRLIHDGRTIDLTQKASETLLALVRQPDVLLTKEDLLATVWRGTAVEENNLTQQVSALRRLLAPGGADVFIQTVPRRGYRFTGPVRIAPLSRPARSDGNRNEPAAAADTSARPTPRPRFAPLLVSAALVVAAVGGIAMIGAWPEGSMVSSESQKALERGTEWEWRSRALLKLGRGEEAIQALGQVAFAPHATTLERAVQQGGAAAGVRALLEVTGNWDARVEDSWRRAPWRAWLGDTDGALEELETAYRMRNYNLIYIAVDPMYDNIRSEPRFRRIVADMGLTR
jgi:DNA-binding winged helix-turn-helix (wHTH) protein